MPCPKNDVDEWRSMEKTHITLKEGGNGGSPRYMAWGNPAESGLNAKSQPNECRRPYKLVIPVYKSIHQSHLKWERLFNDSSARGKRCRFTFCFRLRPECYDCKGQITEKARQKSGSEVLVSLNSNHMTHGVKPTVSYCFFPHLSTHDTIRIHMSPFWFQYRYETMQYHIISLWNLRHVSSQIGKPLTSSCLVRHIMQFFVSHQESRWTCGLLAKSSGFLLMTI